MARKLESWNETAALNNFDVDDGGQPEGHQRVKVNNAGRERMSAHASFYQSGIEWLDLLRDPTDRSIQYTVARASATTISISSGAVDLSALFNVGRWLQTTTAGVQTDYVAVASYANNDPTSTLTIKSTVGDGAVTAGIDGLLLHSITQLGALAFLNSTSAQYIVPATVDETGFDDALTEAASGATILLGVGTFALTNDKTLADGIRLIGQGADKTILQWSGTGGVALLTLGETNGLEALTIEDTGSAGGGGDRHAIYRTGACDDTEFRDVRIKTAVGNAVFFTGSGIRQNIVIDGIDIFRPGWSGIVFEDTDTSALPCSLSNVKIDYPGFGNTGTHYGLDLQGILQMANVSVINMDVASPAIQVGVRFGERIAASPNEEDARDCSVSGLFIEGSGPDAVGILQNGRRCAVTGLSIQLAGASSTGVRVAGTLGSQLASRNTINAGAITAAIGYDQRNTNAEFNSAIGISFADCGIDVRLAAAGAKIANCSMDSCSTGPSIQIQGTASDTDILHNSITGNTGDAISVEGACDDTFIQGNVMNGSAGKGVTVNALATDAVVVGNRANGVSGLDYENLAGTACKMFDNFPLESEVSYFKTSDQTITGTPETNVTVLTALDYPAGDGGPDGVREYLIHFELPITRELLDNATSTTDVFYLYQGANGTKADTRVSKWEQEHEHNSAGPGNTLDARYSMSGMLVVTPAAGDKFGFSWEGDNANSSVTFRGDASSESDALKCVVTCRQLRG